MVTVCLCHIIIVVVIIIIIIFMIFISFIIIIFIIIIFVIIAMCVPDYKHGVADSLQIDKETVMNNKIVWKTLDREVTISPYLSLLAPCRGLRHLQSWPAGCLHTGTEAIEPHRDSNRKPVGQLRTN